MVKLWRKGVGVNFVPKYYDVIHGKKNTETFQSNDEDTPNSLLKCTILKIIFNLFHN